MTSIQSSSLKRNYTVKVCHCTKSKSQKKKRHISRVDSNSQNYLQESYVSISDIVLFFWPFLFFRMMIFQELLICII